MSKAEDIAGRTRSKLNLTDIKLETIMSPGATSVGGAPATVNPVAKLQLPAWDPESPEYWFHGVEAQFSLILDKDGQVATIPPAQKLNALRNVVPAETMKKYLSFVLANDYEGFKKALVGNNWCFLGL